MKINLVCRKHSIIKNKWQLRAIIFNSADTAHLIASPKKNNNIRCIVSVDLKMVARNLPLIKKFLRIVFLLNFQILTITARPRLLSRLCTVKRAVIGIINQTYIFTTINAHAFHFCRCYIRVFSLKFLKNRFLFRILFGITLLHLF